MSPSRSSSGRGVPRRGAAVGDGHGSLAVAIVQLCGPAAQTPAQLAAALDVPLATVRRHVRRLVELNFLAEEAPSRGLNGKLVAPLRSRPGRLPEN